MQNAQFSIWAVTYILYLSIERYRRDGRGLRGEGKGGENVIERGPGGKEGRREGRGLVGMRKGRRGEKKRKERGGREGKERKKGKEERRI